MTVYRQIGVLRDLKESEEDMQQEDMEQELLPLTDLVQTIMRSERE